MIDLKSQAPKGAKANQLLLGNYDTEVPAKVILNQRSDGFRRTQESLGWVNEMQKGDM